MPLRKVQPHTHHAAPMPGNAPFLRNDRRAVLVHPPKGPLEAMATLSFSSRSGRDLRGHHPPPRWPSALLLPQRGHGRNPRRNRGNRQPQRPSPAYPQRSRRFLRPLRALRRHGADEGTSGRPGPGEPRMVMIRASGSRCRTTRRPAWCGCSSGTTPFRLKGRSRSGQRPFRRNSVPGATPGRRCWAAPADSAPRRPASGAPSPAAGTTPRCDTARRPNYPRPGVR